MDLKTRKAIKLAQYIIKNSNNEREKLIARYLLLKLLISIGAIMLILFLSVSCEKEIIQLQPEISSATCQKWYGGHEDTGKGSLYYIYLRN